MSRSIAHMKKGELAVVSSFSDEHLAAKLMEMGCLPGATVRFNFAAPLGDPLCITVAGYELSLRLDEACTVLILS